jgi:sugar phosphate isomerase/epimerase
LKSSGKLRLQERIMKINLYCRLIVVAFCCALLAQTGQSLLAETTKQDSRTPPFYAFCFDTHDAQKRDLNDQAIMLQRLGFDGAGHIGLENVEERVKTLEAVGLKLFLAGIRVDLNNDASIAINELKQALPVLKNRDVVVYVVLTGLPTADPAGTQKAIDVLQKLAAVAEPANVRLGIYPHTADWVAQAAHAVEVANRVDRKNVGVIFNLCHWLRNEPLDTLEPVLQAANGKLFGLTLNGAALAGKNDNDWSRLIQPLDQGDFDVPHLLSLLRRLDYAGPIGLMCYGVGGDAAAHLEKSMQVWQKLQDQ